MTATGVGGGVEILLLGATRPIALGDTGGTAVAGINLSDAEIARISSYGTLTVGEAGVQTGTITVTTVTNPVSAGNLVSIPVARAGSCSMTTMLI